MSQPTTSIGFSPTTPAAPAGYVNTVPQSDGQTPFQTESQYVANVGGVSVKTASYTAVAGDNGTLLPFNSSSALTLTLPAAPPFAKWRIKVQNVGAGVLTIARNGLLIDTAAVNLTLNQNSGVEIYTDGTNYFTERGVATTLPTPVDNEILIVTSGPTIPALAHAPNPASSLKLYWQGARQRYTTDFTVSGTAITPVTFTPSVGDNLIADYRY